MKRRRSDSILRTRNHTAVAAWNRNGGAMGGTVREQNKRERKVARQLSKVTKCDF